MERKRIDRAELYRRVWETPLRTLAREFGVSDVALKKHCRKLDIPTPGLGYWAKREAGHAMRRVPLPKAKANTPNFTEIAGSTVVSPKPAPLEGPVLEQSQYEAEAANKIIVADDLDGAPRSVRARHTAASKPDERGLIQPYGADCLDVVVSPKALTGRFNLERGSRCMCRPWIHGDALQGWEARHP
jgi:hypothetical protein